MLELVVLVLLVFLTCWYFTSHHSNLPPGPSPTFPLVGHLPLLDKDPRPQFDRWRRRYGDVFSLALGSRLVVVLNGYDVIRDAFVKFGADFSERPKMFVTEHITKRGIVFNSGPSWKEQRKVSIEILRSLGMGKETYTQNVQMELQEFLKAVGDLKGKATDLGPLVTVSVSNNICSMVFGRRFEYDCAAFSRYLRLMRENFQYLGSASALNFMPWLRFLPGDVFHLKKLLHNAAEMEQCFLRPLIQQHIYNNASEDDGDFISVYVKRIAELRACGVTNSTINEDNLLWTVSDLFVAGTETMASSLLWTLLYLTHHPHVQEKCFQQVNDVIGVTSLPSLRHRAEMTYVEATIMEVLRMADVAATGFQHGMKREVTFRGFTIPKDAIVVPYLHTVLADREVWGDPDTFRPERFLSSSGDGAIKRPDKFIPFSIGRRACPGEGMARQELFLYVTSLLQRFRFLPQEDGELPPLEGIMGFTHSAKPFRVRAVPRVWDT